MRRVVERRIPAPPEAVLAAALEPVETGFADPVDPRADGSRIAWSSVPDVVARVERVAEVRPDGGGTILTLHARVATGVPYFGWVVRPLARRSVARGLRHMADAIEARALGRPVAPAPRRPAWAPADRMDPAQARALGTLFMLLAVATYGGSLFTQTIDYVADAYGASDADLGLTLALTRIGVLVGLVGSALADRRGRRAVALASLTGVCVTALLSGLAPNLATFGTVQVLNRGFVQLASVVAYIAVTEEAPEGARVYMLAVAGMAAGTGFALGAVMLPLADTSDEAWRALFFVAGLGLLLVPGIARRLPETRRYAAMAARAAHASVREVLDPTYGRRFALVALTVFLLSFFGAPTFQFTNRFLADERGFSALDILVLRAATQSVTALAGAWVGGRLAESIGRRTVAQRATLVLAATTAGFFTLDGAALAVMMLVATAAAGVGGPATAAFNTEMFPTEVRGRAGAALLLAGVGGAVFGLLAVGYLSGPLGSVGTALAATCAMPVAVALLLIPRLPEARGRALDDVSPPEV